MTDLALPLCAEPGCDQFGVWPTTDADGKPVRVCIIHSMDAPAPPPAPPAESWHEETVSGLAAVVLDHTAMTLDDTPDATAQAMLSLTQATGMTQDMAAGLLLATTWLVAAGQLTAEQVSIGADLYEAQADAEVSEGEGAGYVEGEHLCALCESPDHTTDEHENLLYPLPENDNEREFDSDDEDD